jgi:hypothetical protein
MATKPLSQSHPLLFPVSEDCPSFIIGDSISLNLPRNIRKRKHIMTQDDDILPVTGPNTLQATKASTPSTYPTRKAADSSKKVKQIPSYPSEDIRESLFREFNTPCSPLPDFKKEDVNPVAYLQDLVHALYGYKPIIKSAFEIDGYFSPITEEQIVAYDLTVVTAARNNDLETLQQLYKDGQQMDCCNRFGESLLHMACRRGFTELGTFLLEEAKLKVRIMDDCGRNPFHDICWNPRVLMDLAEEILKRDPTLLLIGDKRGHTPFDYARPQDWKVWREFLFNKRDLLQPLGGEDVRNIFEQPIEKNIVG